MNDSAKLASRRIYTGRVLNLDIDTVQFPNGSTGELEIIRHSGASAIVPFVSDPLGPDPQVLLIRQFRYAANGYVYEIPAGRLDPGEEPITCAHRELREETGCTAQRIERLFTMFTTPGFTDERIHVFLATGLVLGPTEHDTDEFLEVQTVALSKALSMIESGAIQDGKTALALLFIAGFRIGQ
ncbi:MAG TPA: NUDIX hydrolase [Gemmatimonadaceae bacterium]|nr:NUDIX hydrolase [Gemmatimonadaceae bacterium]